MNITDIVDAVAAQTDITKGTIKKILLSATEAVVDSLEQGNSVHIRGLGFFSVKEYLPRKIFSPRKNEVIISAGTKKVIYKQSPTLKIKNGKSSESHESLM